ncbi:4-hydroxybenzoyl-CoA thioesterase [Fulvivirga imtechensis AK7]|uniref:4-hydroxybenzoyl-CoA thioesterase n=1 Tax=Fulvivirga imtechensis AK7 TaxID=1237149 RepID=L8JUS0_9BACT|nr:acyl-CoA thioesterase [Fulvivirga imtechensis]ELR71304.1 4-hydroxybenzoyl-CoA thioesterase [Fulvivirga imtechensis AK7]
MLVDKAEIKVRFSEVDSMGILWHGHYIKYFEDGRESFGRNFNLGYFDVYDQGYLIPIVKIDCSFKKPIQYKDEVAIETTFIDTPAAKIIFEYKLYSKQSGDVYATGRSEQVFLDKNRQLYLTVPDFFAQWKQHWGIVNS